MRRLAIAALFLVAAVSAQASTPRIATVAGGISLRVPPGWHIVRGWLSDVVIPIPRLAVASFNVRLSRRTCECGMPNVRGLPHNGAFLFVWEYPELTRRQLERVPRRPSRFPIPSGAISAQTCGGPSDELVFRTNGREFQVEIYVAAGASLRARARLAQILDSLRVTPGPVSLRRA